MSQLPTMRESSQPSCSEGTRVSAAQCSRHDLVERHCRRARPAPAVYFGGAPERKLPRRLAWPPPLSLIRRVIGQAGEHRDVLAERLQRLQNRVNSKSVPVSAGFQSFMMMPLGT